MTSVVVGIRRLLPLVFSKPTRNLQKCHRSLPWIDSEFCFNNNFKFFSSRSSGNSSSQTTVEKTESAAEESTNVTFLSHDEKESKDNAIRPKPDSEDMMLFTEEVEIKAPDLGEDKLQVEKWYKKEGDLIKTNDTLCDISTEVTTPYIFIDWQN